MKKIFFLTLSCLLFSACSLSRQTSPTSSDPLDQTYQTERTELGKEATSPSDQAVLKAFDQDKDTDFSSEFKQLDTDLQ